MKSQVMLLIALSLLGSSAKAAPCTYDAASCRYQAIAEQRARLKALCKTEQCRRDVELALLTARAEARGLRQQDPTKPKPTKAPVTVPTPPPKVCANCGPTGSPSLLPKELSELSSMIDQSHRCTQLKVGEAQSFNNDTDDSASGIEQRYRLTRVSDKEYEVALNLQFTMPTSERLVDAALARDLRTRTQACIQQMNPKLLGPGGARLRLKLTERFDPNQAPLVHIKIMGPKVRSTSRQYAEDIDCPTIAHELMHLLGLCDEYKEKTIGYTRNADGDWEKNESGNAYDCRALGPENSLMTDQWERFKQVYGTMRTIKCECFASCPKNWDGTKERRACPMNSRGTETTIPFTPGATPNTQVIDDKTLLVTLQGPAPLQESLLEPTQFYAIAYPGCSILKDYYSCAKNAYLTSGKDGCKELPPSCKNGSQDWMKGGSK